MNESPIPRKRRQKVIESDSDDETAKQNAKRGKLNFVSSSVPPQPDSTTDGKRRVKKTVTTTSHDEDGFMGEFVCQCL